MSTSLSKAYLPLMAQMLQDRAISRQMIRMSLLLAAAEILLLSLHSARNESVKLVMICLPWALLQIWAGAFLRNAIRQNRPEYACLVPNLRGRLIRLLAAWYILDAMLLSIMSWLAFDHAGYGLVFGGAAIVIGIFVNRYTVLGWVMAIVIPFGISFVVDNVLAALPHVSEAGFTLAAVPAIVLLAGWGLHLLLPRGGDGHWAWQARFSQRQDALAGKPVKPSATQQCSSIRQLWRRFYLATLARDSQPGTTAGRAMMHVIGPGAHPGYVIAYSLCSTGLALLIGGFLGESARAGLLTMVALAQLAAVLMYALRVANDIVYHGAEQQLYFLTPAAPSAARINRLLTATVLRRALLVWLVSLGCATVLDSVLAGHLTLRGPSFAIGMGVLWTLKPLLRNYAIVPARLHSLEWTVILMLFVLVCLGVIATTRATPHFPWYALGVLAGMAALVRLALRWRALIALPPVLPVGRLAV